VAFAESLSGNAAVVFMVAAGLVYEIIAAACSSPQTSEINAAKRSATLMKWVFIGLAQAALFILITATRLKGGAPAIYGGLLAAALMFGSYLYANKAGLRNGGTPTETY
jgi:hypothetical protein